MALIFKGNQEFSTNASSYTVSSADIGVASADRYVFVSAGGRGSTANSVISSVSVGGISATEVETVTVGSGGFRSRQKAYKVLVTSGFTADIVLNFTGSVLRAGIAWWIDDDLLSSTKHDSAVNSSGSDSSISINKPKYGWIIYHSFNYGSDPSTPIGYTEEFEENVEGSGNSHTGGQYATDGALTSETLEASWASTSVSTAIGVSFENNPPQVQQINNTLFFGAT